MLTLNEPLGRGLVFDPKGDKLAVSTKTGSIIFEKHD